MSDISFLVETENAHWDATKQAAYIWFPKAQEELNGCYYCRGGVCFPGTVNPRHDGYFSGFFVVLGVNLRTRGTYLFALHEWQVVTSVVEPTGGIAFRGIRDFLASVWAKFYADTFYFHGDEETMRKVLMEIQRDVTILPQPSLVEVLFDDPEQAIMQAIQWGRTRRLHLPLYLPEGQAFSDRINLQLEHLDTPGPDVWALACAVAGIANAPPDFDVP